MNKLTILPICLLLLVGKAQAQTELKNALTELQKALKEVTTAKGKYEQKLEFNADKPFKVVLYRTEIDGKGKAEDFQYLFNMGALDKNTVRIETGKESIKVEARADKGQNIIKTIKEGEQQNYTDRITIYATDIDDARQLEKLLKNAVPLADAAWTNSINLPDDLPGLMAELKKRIKDARTDSKQTRQQLEYDAKTPDMAKLTTSEESSSGGGYTTEFSLADLSVNSVEIKVSGKRVAMQAETKRKQRFIKSTREKDGTTSFENDLTVYFEDPDEATLVVQLFEKAIPLAEKALEARLPKPANLQEATALLAANIVGFKQGETVYEQTLKVEGTQLTYNYNRSNNKEAAQYVVNLADLTDRDVELQASGKNLEVKAETVDRERFVEEYSAGQIKGFDASITFLANDIEKARVLHHVLPMAIRYAKSPLMAETPEALLAGFKAEKYNFEGTRQQLETAEGSTGTCKLLLIRNTDGKSKSTEERFEFNLGDLDPRYLKIAAAGKQLKLELNTKGKEKLIKSYENGKPGFTGQISIYATRVDQAKKLRATLKTLIEGCK